MTDLIKKVQTLAGVVSDGVIGSKTLAAIAEVLDIKPSSYKKTTIKIDVEKTSIGFDYETSDLGDGGTYNVNGDTATEE